MFQRNIAIGALIWTIALLLTHFTVPTTWQWGVAAGFSVSMNLVYPWQAFRTGKAKSIELGIASLLIVLSVAGAMISPWFLVAAVAGHGLWDYAKHMGAGVPFFSWYILGCAAVDGLWAAGLILLIYSPT